MGKNTDAWKDLERHAARVFGGRRSSAPWGNYPDVEGDDFIAECKLRAQLPKWIKNALVNAEHFASGRLPFVVLHQKGERHVENLIVLRERDFIKIFEQYRKE